MSEGGGEALGPPYAGAGGFQSSQPPTPSSTVPDAAGADPNSKSSSSSGLPPFSSFTATELAEGLGSRLGPEGFGTETYTGRLLDFPGWGYYDEGLSGRLLDRGDGLPMLISHSQYRPWESKPMDSQDGFTKYDYPASPASKLPSFQSQFNAFPEQNGETISLTTLTPAPPSPTTNNSGLPSFHTLSTVTVNPRGYPLVPAPVQAREIPTIQQQFLDERHIHLFQSPTTLNNAQYHPLGLTSANPGIIQGNFVTHPQPPQQATLLTVVKTEPVAIVTTQLHQQPSHIYQNSNAGLDHDAIKVEESTASPRGLQDSRKKERRKIRASSMDSSVESDVGSSSVESSGQVAAISSTASFKSPLMQHQSIGSMNVPVGGQHGENEECENGTGEKQTKKKRKRCGECIGCQRKDNCGDCAPCRNDKSHQICKMRRCEKLTDKKHLLYLTNDFPRTESRRGRGKGTRASYRNKGGRGGSNANQSQGPPTPQQAPSSSGTVTPQPAAHPQSSTIVALNGNEPSPNPTMMTTADHSPGSVMPFYGSNIPAGGVTEATPGFVQTVREHRFPNAVWQQASVPADAAMGTWPPQGQFIQQLPPPQIDELRYHPQYPAAAPVTVSSYTQPTPGYQPAQSGFLQTNGTPYQTSQPPAASPLLNGGTTTRNGPVNGTIDYVDASPRPTEYLNGAYTGQETTLVPQPSSTPNSRCSSVQNLDSNTSDSLPPSKTPTTVNNYIQPIGTPSQVTNQGNAMPGYPPPQPPQSQQSLHNSSGYPGQNTQSVTHRFMGEDMNSKRNSTPKEWSHQEQSAQNTRKEQASNTWPNDEKHNAVYGNAEQPQYRQQQQDDRTNVNNKLKTMILSKQQTSNHNQNHFPANQNYQDNQFAQQKMQQQHNQQFCSPTPPPMSPVHQIPQSPSQNMQLSSQHFQFNSNQNRNAQQQQQMQPTEQLQHQQRQQQQQQQHFQQKMQQQMQQQQHQQIQQQQQQQMQQQQQAYQQQIQHQQQMQHEQQQLNHQMQQQQQQMHQQEQQKQQQQQLAHQMQQQQQQQHLHQQQQMQMHHQMQQQSQQQQHLQQQQAKPPESSPKHFYENQNKRIALDKNLVSPQSYQTNIKQEPGTYQGSPHQQHTQKQYMESYGNKTQMNNGNFLAQGHHPRSLATEGGGFWDFSPSKKPPPNVGGESSAMENFFKYADERYEAPKNDFYPARAFATTKESTTVNAIATQTTPVDNDHKTEPENAEGTTKESVSNFGQQTDNAFWDPIGRDKEKSERNNNQVENEPNEKNESTWYNHKILLDDRRPKPLSQDQQRPKTPFGEDPRPQSACDLNPYAFTGEGGPKKLEKISGSWCCRKGGTDTPTVEHLRDGCCSGMKTMDEVLDDDCDEIAEDKTKIKKEPLEDDLTSDQADVNAAREIQENIERLKNNIKTEVPECDCFPSDKFPPEPGSYYTHLGAAANLAEMRQDLENRLGYKGNAIRIEKILYTGKEGKTTQGCPLAKWVIRRSSQDEKVLVLVKHRPGHKCPTAWIIVILVAWEGVPRDEADVIYNMLVHKLNKFGLPTLRRCATNEPRTCACQGLDPETCGASFSFGCSWSMYYNGCKYARSKTVRKFRLSVRSEEQEVEERIHSLATLLSPLYERMAPKSFQNMTQFEREASECRLGFKNGRPFSGVTACVDFCAHAHRDMHNMNNGCTTVVTLSKHRSLSKTDDEQLHVLPLYTIDDTDEFGDKENQLNKIKNGSVEVLTKFPCEVRVRSVPLQPCRRHGKKRKDDDTDSLVGKKESLSSRQSPSSDARLSRPSSVASDGTHGGFDSIDSQLQSSQVSSTVLDSPVYQGWNYGHGINPNQNLIGDSLTSMKGSWFPLQVSQPQFSSEWQNISSTAPDSVTSWSNTQSDADSTTINSRSSSSLSAPDPSLRNQFAQSKPFSSASPSPSTSNYSRTPTPVSNRSTLPSLNSSNPFGSSYSTPNLTDWGLPETNESWEFSNPMTPISHRASPFPISGNRTSIRQSPNLQSPSVDSYQSRSPSNESNFLKPYPPSDKLDTENTLLSPGSSHFRASKRSEFGDDRKCFSKNMAKTDSSPSKSNASKNDNVKLIDKGTTVDANIFKASVPPLPYQNQKHEQRFWLGADDMRPFADTNSSPNPTSPFVPINPAYGYGGSNFAFPTLPDPYANQFSSPFGAPTPDLGHQFMKNEDKSSFSSSPSPLNSYQFPRWDLSNASPSCLPVVPESPKSEPLGEVIDFVDNEECFKDPQMGGVAIALSHGSVLFECAKHELHSTTALKKPNRRHPTRVSLVFYQHRNLNRPKHGWEEWEEKTRLKKLGITASTSSSTLSTTSSTSTSTSSSPSSAKDTDFVHLVPNVDKLSSLQSSSQFMLHTNTFPTITWTTLFPMHPCITSGPYKDNKLTDVR